MIFLDRQIVIGCSGEHGSTGWLQLRGDQIAQVLTVEAEDLLGESAIAVWLETAVERTTARVASPRVEAWQAGIWSIEVAPPHSTLVSVCTEILRDELPDAEWQTAPARLVLTVRLRIE